MADETNGKSTDDSSLNRQANRLFRWVIALVILSVMVTVISLLTVSNTNSTVFDMVNSSETEVAQNNGTLAVVMSTLTAVSEWVADNEEQVENVQTTLTAIEPAMTDVAQTIIDEIAQNNSTLEVIVPTLTAVSEWVADNENQVENVQATLTAIDPVMTEVAKTIIDNEYRAESMRLANEAQVVLDTPNNAGDIELAALLTIRALKMAYSYRADEQLQNAIVELFLETGIFRRENPFHAVDFSPDGQTVITGRQDGTLRLWNIETLESLLIFGDHESSISSVVFSPDGKTVLSGSTTETLHLSDAETGETLRIFEGNPHNLSSVSFSVAYSPDGKTVLSGSRDKTLRLWDVETGELLRVFEGHTDGVNSVAYSPDSKTVLSGSKDKTLRLWDVETGKTLRVFEGHTREVIGVAFSPDGKQVLSGSWDSTLRLWNVETGELVRVFEESIRILYSVAFSPDGQLVFSGIQAWDRIAPILYVWDANTGELLRKIANYWSTLVNPIALHPDGKTVVSYTQPGFVLVPFRINYHDSLDQACMLVNRDFTEEERVHYGIIDNEPTCPKFATADNPMTTAMPPTTTPHPTGTIPVWTPIASPTATYTFTPTNTFTPTITPTVPQTPTSFPPLTPTATNELQGDVTLVDTYVVKTGEVRAVVPMGGGQIWQYEGSTGERITITVEAQWDTTLQLLVDGEVIAYNDDFPSTTGSYNSKIQTTLLEDGLYEIEVRSFGNYSGGEYTLVVESIPAISTPTATSTSKNDQN